MDRFEWKVECSAQKLTAWPSEAACAAGGYPKSIFTVPNAATSVPMLR